MNEKISELIDNELDPDSRELLFDNLVGAGAACTKWQRYHLIGNVIRAETSVTGKDISAEVMARIAEEPTVLAPVSRDSTPATVRSDIIKSAAMFAMAASLVLVAVVTLRTGVNPSAGPVVADTGGNQESDALQFAQEFDEMLVGHGEFTASSSLNGLVAYANLVSNQKLDQ